MKQLWILTEKIDKVNEKIKVLDSHRTKKVMDSHITKMTSYEFSRNEKERFCIPTEWKESYGFSHNQTMESYRFSHNEKEKVLNSHWTTQMLYKNNENLWILT